MQILPLLILDCNKYFRLFLLTALIPADEHPERELSLTTDRALMGLEVLP